MNPPQNIKSHLDLDVKASGICNWPSHWYEHP